MANFNCSLVLDVREMKTFRGKIVKTEMEGLLEFRCSYKINMYDIHSSTHIVIKRK